MLALTAVVAVLSATTTTTTTAAEPVWVKYLPKAVRDLMNNGTLNRSAVPWTSWVGGPNASDAAPPTDPSLFVNMFKLPDLVADGTIPEPPWMAKLPKPVRDIMLDPTLNKSAIPWTDWVSEAKKAAEAADAAPPTDPSMLLNLFKYKDLVADGTLPEPPWMAKLPKAVHDIMLDPTLNKSTIPAADWLSEKKKAKEAAMSANNSQSTTDPSLFLNMIKLKDLVADGTLPEPPWMAKLPKPVRDVMLNSTLNKSAIPWTAWVPEAQKAADAADAALADPSLFVNMIKLKDLIADGTIPEPPWMAKLPKPVRDIMHNSTLNKSAIPWTAWMPADKMNATAMDPAPPLPMLRAGAGSPLGVGHLAVAFGAGMALTVAVLSVSSRVRALPPLLRLRLGRNANEASLTHAILSTEERNAGILTGAYSHC